jgi:succinoglycan biosynthesis protein ExoO
MVGKKSYHRSTVILMLLSPRESSSLQMRSPPPPSNTRPPDVSFIVATYNVAPYVQAAVASALEQVGVDVEVIVADDASVDGTADLVAALAGEDPRITLIRRASNAGPARARNDAMARARGTWMAILDGDDVVAPDRSRRLLDLAAATSADVVADNFERVLMDGRSTGITMIPQGPEPYSLLVDIAAFLRGNTIFDRRSKLGYIKPMFRSDFLRAKAIRHQEDIHIGEDYELCLSCLMAEARLIVTSQSFYKYRTRPGSLSWRMSARHIDRLLLAHREACIDVRFAADARIQSASRRYQHALERAKVLTDIVGLAKRADWLGAATLAICRPALWPLLARFGGEAVARRLMWSAAGERS